MPTARIVFDKPTFAPGEPITGQVVVDDVAEPVHVDFTADYAVDAQVGTATGTAVVASTVTYGQVTATGYAVTPDSGDPSRFTATQI